MQPLFICMMRMHAYAYASVCIRMFLYASVCIDMQPYASICLRHASVWQILPKYIDNL